MGSNLEDKYPTQDFRTEVQKAMRGNVRAFVKVRDLAFGPSLSKTEKPIAEISHEDLLSADEDGFQWPSAENGGSMNADLLSFMKTTDPVHTSVDSRPEQNPFQPVSDSDSENPANSELLSPTLESELAEGVAKATPGQGEATVPKGGILVNKQPQFRVFLPSPQIRQQREGGKHVVVTGAYAPVPSQPGVLVEIIRSPENPERLVFLRWEDGIPATFNGITYKEKTFVPPDPTSDSFPSLSLPMGLLPCGDASDTLSEVREAISKFVKLPFEQSYIVAAFVIASWFPDCFEAAPHLWIVGPLDSGKTKLLRVLSCMCRRGLITGDLKGGSIYQLLSTRHPTLIIDEFEQGSSVASCELLRMLRSGSGPGVRTVRNGRQFSTYGLKVIASRQPFHDAALLSRGFVIAMLSTADSTLPLDEEAMGSLEKEWQAKLCMFRLENFERVKNNLHSADRLPNLIGRMRQIGLALTAPFGEHHRCLSTLHEILNEHENEGRIERSLEPEWLVAEVLLEQCHQESVNGEFIREILVGDVAAHVNEKLRKQNEHVSFSAKKVGLILRSLGIKTKKLGRAGRGLTFSTGLLREIHEIAAQLGMLQRDVAQSKGTTGDSTCRLCEEYRPHR